MKPTNATGYDRTKGSKKTQGIFTPKAPQNRGALHRFKFEPNTGYKKRYGRSVTQDIYTAFIGMLALQAFHRNQRQQHIDQQKKTIRKIPQNAKAQ